MGEEKAADGWRKGRERLKKDTQIAVRSGRTEQSERGWLEKKKGRRMPESY